MGVICQRDAELLKDEGIIMVRFELDLENLPLFNKSYLMFETSAYFESYKHVLEALVSLRHLDEAEFPFKKNLIDCQNQEIGAPAYLKDKYIDFR